MMGYFDQLKESQTQKTRRSWRKNEVLKTLARRRFLRLLFFFPLDSAHRFIFILYLLSRFLLCFISFPLTVRYLTSLLSLPGRSVDPRAIPGIETGSPTESKAAGIFGEDQGKVRRRMRDDPRPS